jgi:cbb3-type cytochrome oxidase subunit 3
LRRVDPISGTSITLPFEGELTVDSNALGKQYGWHTSGDEEIIIHSTYDTGRGSALVFDDSTNDTARDKYMRDYVFTEDAHGVHEKTVNVLTQPNNLQCHTFIRMRDADRFEEFQRPCSGVVATRADNMVAGIKLTTTSDTLCSVTLGFQDDDIFSVASLSASRPTTIRGSDRWRCITQENHGLSCGNNRSFELFSPDIVNESGTTVVLESDEIVNGRGGIDVSVPGIKTLGFSWLSNIIEVIKVVATFVTIISIIITLIQVGLYMYRRHKKKKADEEMSHWVLLYLYILKSLAIPKKKQFTM